jgi:hypothetical protein
VGTFNTFIHKTFLIVSRIILNIRCCVHDRVICTYQSQLKLHRHRPLHIDHLHVAKLKSYNKRCMRYFVKLILNLMRIIYFLSRAHCYFSGSSRNMTRMYKEKSMKMDHAQSRRVQQSHQKETYIAFDSQMLWRCIRLFWKAYEV